MPDRFDSSPYDPELTKLMKDAFHAAWHKCAGLNSDPLLGRKLLASAIIDAVDAGARDRDEVVSRAVATLAAANNITAGR